MKDFLNKKNIINLLLLGIMVLAIPLTVKLARQQQLRYYSKAAEAQVTFLTKDQGGNFLNDPNNSSCVTTRRINGVDKQVTLCQNIRVRLTAPTGSDIRWQGRTSLFQEGIVKKAYAQAHECAVDGARSDEAGDSSTPNCGGHKICHYEGDTLKWGDYRCEFCTNGASNPPDCDNNQCNPTCTGDRCGQSDDCNGKCTGDENTPGKCGNPTSGGGTPQHECAEDGARSDEAGDSSTPNCGGHKICHYEGDTLKWGDYRCEFCTNNATNPPDCNDNASGPTCTDYQRACSNGSQIQCHNGVAQADGTCADGSGSSCDQSCPTGDTGVPVGTGGCCSTAADCKVSNIYNGQSTQGWTCTDTNPNCVGGQACEAPAGGGVPVGTGGCCNHANGNNDCKASNTYNGQSTQGWTCTDNNPNCSGGSACRPPADSGFTGAPGTGGCCSNTADCIVSNRFGRSTDPKINNKTSEGMTCSVRNPNCQGSGNNSCYPSPAPSGSPRPTPTPAPSGAVCYFCEQGVGLRQWGGTCPASAASSCSRSIVFGGYCRGPAQLADNTCGTGVSPSPSSSPPVTITKYRFAENPTDLANAQFVDYAQGGVIIDHNFTDTTPGPKFIYYQFQDSAGNITEQKNGSILYVGPDPVITGSACNIKQELKENLEAAPLLFEVNGINFGNRDQASSHLAADNSNLEIREWTNQKVVARMVNPPDTTDGKTYTVALTRSDGVRATATCSVNTTQISFGAKLFCRTPNNYDQDNVDLLLVQSAVGVGTTGTGNFRVGSKALGKVTITREGIINNLRTKLQEGWEYIACIKAPKSLRVCTNPFRAVSGNNIIYDFFLPIGDLNADDIINSVDASSLRQQWGLMTANKNCDFNKDNVCNSFEWACMLHDFNKPSAQEPQ